MTDNVASGRRAKRAGSAVRRNRLHLRLSDSEKQLIQMAAAREGLSAGAYAARAAVAVAKGAVVPIPMDERERLQELTQARVAVNRIGTNLNQIARTLNAEGEVTPQQLQAILTRVVQTVERLDEATIVLLGPV